jgi:hypothetical protein
VREHRYVIEMPHPPARVWALMQDYDNWTAFAPMVVAVEVIHPGDVRGNGLVRRVIYRLPFGRRGSALELVTDVMPDRGYTYTMLSKTPGNDQTGRLELEPGAGGGTLLRFEERFNVESIPWKWIEGPVYRFINRKNEASMRALSAWLTAHPEYRPDLPAAP